MEKAPPPEILSPESKKIWKRVVTCGFSEARLVLLEQSLLALDRANEARQILKQEGLITRTGRSGVTHLHPAARIERENRQLFMRTWKGMGLHWDPNTDGH